MKTNNTALLEPAMQLIKKYAPHTHEAMTNAKWQIDFVSCMDDLKPIFDDYGYELVIALAYQLNSSLAATAASVDEFGEKIPAGMTPPDLLHTTWMNKPAIEAEAAQNGFDPVKLAANVLVHEWQHRKGYGEKEAYDAGTKFALAMGEPGIAANSAKKGREIVGGQKLAKLFRRN